MHLKARFLADRIAAQAATDGAIVAPVIQQGGSCGAAWPYDRTGTAAKPSRTGDNYARALSDHSDWSLAHWARGWAREDGRPVDPAVHAAAARLWAARRAALVAAGETLRYWA